MRPHQILNLDLEPTLSDGLLLDFDLAVVGLHDWVEAKSNEQEIVSDDGPKPGKGQTWGAKYRHIEDIFELYYRGERQFTAIDPEAQALDLGDVMREYAEDVEVDY